jgi:hypothetical protein
VQRLDDTILEVARENEAAIPGKFFHKITKCGLSRIGIKIIRFVEDDIFPST